MPFPLPFIPRFSYKVGGRRFGARRANNRIHAGCDLLAPVGTPIYAIADGEVVEASNHEFYHGTKALVIRHGGFVVRYCEIRGFGPAIQKLAPPNGRQFARVKAGDVIAYVGRMITTSMLHFEVYEGTLDGPLTIRANKPFQRRADLLNPTALLDRLANTVSVSMAPVLPPSLSDAVSR